MKTIINSLKKMFNREVKNGESKKFEMDKAMILTDEEKFAVDFYINRMEYIINNAPINQIIDMYNYFLSIFDLSVINKMEKISFRDQLKYFNFELNINESTTESEILAYLLNNFGKYFLVMYFYIYYTLSFPKKDEVIYTNSIEKFITSNLYIIEINEIIKFGLLEHYRGIRHIYFIQMMQERINLYKKTNIDSNFSEDSKCIDVDYKSFEEDIAGIKEFIIKFDIERRYEIAKSLKNSLHEKNITEIINALQSNFSFTVDKDKSNSYDSSMPFNETEEYKDLVFENDRLNKILISFNDEIKDDIVKNLIKLLFIEMEKYGFENVPSTGEYEYKIKKKTTEEEVYSKISLLDHTLNLLDIYLVEKKYFNETYGKNIQNELILAAILHDFGKSDRIKVLVNESYSYHNYVSVKYINESLLNDLRQTLTIDDFEKINSLFKNIVVAIYNHHKKNHFKKDLTYALKDLDKKARSFELNNYK